MLQSGIHRLIKEHMKRKNQTKSKEEVRVRFAPSPTGYLHIGGARTALYNWLWKEKTGGTLILRIEDTDVERSTQESVQQILDGLTWLELDWEEGPFFQSKNLERHSEAAQRLLKEGHAYRCFCTKDELDKQRQQAEAKKVAFQYDGRCRRLTSAQIKQRLEDGDPYVIRFKVPEDPIQTVIFDDVVFGRMEKHCKDIEDFVIVRSDGRPLYILSNAVDDILDRITHVIRGADGLANTPKQVLIYHALGEKTPLFVHMPLTLDTKKAKLSKRKHGEVVTIGYYRDRGIIPWALCNFMALLGWSPGDEREFFSKKELIETFDLTRINRANSVFNYSPGDDKNWTDPKLLHFNAHYLRSMPLKDLMPLVEHELKAAGLWKASYVNKDKKWFLDTLDLIRARYHTIKDFSSKGRSYFADKFDVDQPAIKKNLGKDKRLPELLPELAEKLAELDDFSLESTEEVFRTFADENEVKAGIIINAARTVVSGTSVGPPLFDMLVAIGQDRVVKRLKDGVNLIPDSS